MSVIQRAVPLILLVSACKFGSEPRLVSIDPDYAYTDGCTDVTLSGSNMGTDATATIGGNAIEALAPAENDPTRGDRAQDVGFKYYGMSPAASDAAGGFVDVVLTAGGKDYTLDRGFYYIACPATFSVDDIATGDTNAPGDVISVTGCGIDVANITGGVYSMADLSEVAPFALESDCRGATTHFTLPDVPDGDYYVSLTHTDGTVFGDLCDPAVDPGTDTGAPCAWASPVTITVLAGGAQ